MKADVMRWETVATYVATYPDGETDGACNVEVQVGGTDGACWYIRTSDDAGGSDDAPDTAYATWDAAVETAEAFAEDRDEGDGATAADVLRAAKEAVAGQPDPDGAWGVYWDAAGAAPDLRECYATHEQAAAAADLANEDLRAANPGTLLGGYKARRIDGREEV